MALSAVQGFLAANNVRVLNVAGPRQSGSAAVYAYVHGLLSSLLRRLA